MKKVLEDKLKEDEKVYKPGPGDYEKIDPNLNPSYLNENISSSFLSGRHEIKYSNQNNLGPGSYNLL